MTKFCYFSYFLRVRPALVGESAPRGQKVTNMAPFSTPQRSENRVRSLKSHVGQVLKSQKSSQSGLEGRWKVTEAISLKKGGSAGRLARFWGYFPKEGEVPGKTSPVPWISCCVALSFVALCCRRKGMKKKRSRGSFREAFGD